MSLPKLPQSGAGKPLPGAPRPTARPSSKDGKGGAPQRGLPSSPRPQKALPAAPARPATSIPARPPASARPTAKPRQIEAPAPPVGRPAANQPRPARKEPVVEAPRVESAPERQRVIDDRPQYEDHADDPNPLADPPTITEGDRRRAKLQHDQDVQAMESAVKKGALPDDVKKEVMNEGARMRMIRGFIFAFIAVMLALSVKALFFSPKIPSDLDLAVRVTHAMNKTSFPAERANGFAQEFLSTYLTSNDNSTERRTKLLKFTTKELSDTGMNLSFPSGYKQLVSDGPYIYGIRYTSEDTAVYTMGAEVNGNSWEYYAVSIYYDRESKSFVVPKAPSVVPTPELGEAPAEAEIQGVDEAASGSARATVDSYFSAWTSGAETELSVALSSDASFNARNSGLPKSGIKFGEVKSLQVLTQDESLEGSNQYFAVASVGFKKPVSVEEGSGDEEISYTAEYNLVLEYSGKGDKWLVSDIQPREYIPGS